MPSVLALHEAEHKMRQQMQDKADRYLSPAHVLQGCYAWDDESGSDDGKRQGVERNRRQLHPFVRPLRPELARRRFRIGLAHRPHPNLLFFGKPFGGRRPASARLPIQSLRSALATVQVRPDVSFQVRPSFKLEDLGVGDAAVLVALQAHALAAGHFRHLRRSGRRRSLRFSPTTATWSPSASTRRPRPCAVRVDVEDLLALAGVGDRRRRPARRSRARREPATSSFVPGLVGEGRDDVGALVEIDHQADRIAEAAPAGQLRRLEREDLAVRGHARGSSRSSR